ncbi:chaperone protein HscA homolog [Pseudomonas sp. St290]|nr:chaperone protein HscA homolog [Pseudomonas sp. St290]
MIGLDGGRGQFHDHHGIACRITLGCTLSLGGRRRRGRYIGGQRLDNPTLGPSDLRFGRLDATNTGK